MVTLKDVKALRSGQTLYHKTMVDSRGASVKGRVNGAVKLWKTRPKEFRVPMKHGLYDYFYITQDNADEWTLTPRKTGK